MKTFAEHFLANALYCPDHYNDPNAVIGFAGLNHNHLIVTERNIFNGMPGCNCAPRAFSLADCTCHAKPILEEDGARLVYSMSKLREVDKDWRSAILGGRKWEVLSSDMDIEEPEAAGIIALALSNKAALATGHLEMMMTLKSLCRPDPRTLEIPWGKVKAAMLKTCGPFALDDACHNAFKLMVAAGGHESKSWADFFQWAGYFINESKRMIRPEAYRIFAEYPSSHCQPCQNASKVRLGAEAN